MSMDFATRRPLATLTKGAPMEQQEWPLVRMVYQEWEGEVKRIELGQFL